MPNWAEGTLKIRGTKENIKRFILNGLSPAECGSPGTIIVTENEYSLNVNTSNNSIFYLNGTHRHFINSECIEFDFSSSSPVSTLCLHEFMAAWRVYADDLLEIAKTYEVDLKVYAFECGQGFNQDIEIVGGIIVKDNLIEFDDYVWECTCPQFGG